MKLRTLIFVALVLVAVLPVGLLAWWQHKTVVESEFSVVENQHQVIAGNLVVALERYAADLESSFRLAEENLAHSHPIAGLEQHLGEVHFQRIVAIEPNGRILARQCALICPQDEYFSNTVLATLQPTIGRAASQPGRVLFSPVTFDPRGNPAIYLAMQVPDGHLALGEVRTDYLVELQRGISFGVKGHAAIVDHAGHVIAHPRDEWTREIRDLSAISIVQQMMNGESGVTRFYSPAAEADMVAGFNVVSGPGWGVMVPQPQQEIFQQTQDVSRAALTIAVAGLFIAGFLGWWFAGILARPMGLMSEAAMNVARGDLASKVELPERLRPIEIRRLQASFNQMLDDVGRKNTVLVNLAHEAVMSNNHKSAFISSMNHELRTPMNAVLGFAQMLEINQQEPLSESQQTAVEHILRNGNHLLELIDQMMDLNKIEAGTLPLNMEQIPARDVFDETLYLIRARANHDEIDIIDDTLGKKLPLLWTDSTRLIQVLLNLMSNAVKYNRKGGYVKLSCEKQANDMLRIKVTDNGLGIRSELQDRLFTPFERLGHELGQIDGTGIGLSISRQIVEMLEGEIGFESEYDVGSCFWVDIPLSDDETILEDDTPVDRSKNKADDDPNRVRTLLYIEDNPDNLNLMEAIIGQFRHLRLLSAPNALVGYDLATSKRPDLILMDINLPGMNGLQALKRLRDTPETRDIPVIAVTSNSQPGDIAAGLKAGFTAYLTKPIKVSDLMRTIEKTLARLDGEA